MFYTHSWGDVMPHSWKEACLNGKGDESEMHAKVFKISSPNGKGYELRQHDGGYGV